MAWVNGFYIADLLPDDLSRDITCYIIDSGASFHFVGKEGTECFHAAAPVSVQTIAGNIDLQRKTEVDAPRLGKVGSAYVSPGSPDVLSLGLLVALGFSFHWEAEDALCLYLVDRSSGEKITLNVTAVCPTLAGAGRRLRGKPHRQQRGRR